MLRAKGHAHFLQHPSSQSASASLGLSRKDKPGSCDGRNTSDIMLPIECRGRATTHESEKSHNIIDLQPPWDSFVIQLDPSRNMIETQETGEDLVRGGHTRGLRPAAIHPKVQARFTVPSFDHPVSPTSIGASNSRSSHLRRYLLTTHAHEGKDNQIALRFPPEIS